MDRVARRAAALDVNFQEVAHLNVPQRILCFDIQHRLTPILNALYFFDRINIARVIHFVGNNTLATLNLRLG